ncbi:hypothetical protein AMELA_G00224750 [Ameiurus melas]|uniref:Uncharacterized protein n=1 Tax=Ameiurus melas TaxID=219545 RepID=A0A7J6A206_AMEME|nr:hypothetical protein AMELA_G00224750 [Ameiurus melas]
MSSCCALGGILEGWTLMGSFTTVLSFPFGDKSSYWGSLKSQSLPRLPRLMYLSHLLPHHFWKIFQLWHSVWLHLVQLNPIMNAVL